MAWWMDGFLTPRSVYLPETLYSETLYSETLYSETLYSEGKGRRDCDRPLAITQEE